MNSSKGQSAKITINCKVLIVIISEKLDFIFVRSDRSGRFAYLEKLKCQSQFQFGKREFTFSFCSQNLLVLSVQNLLSMLQLSTGVDEERINKLAERLFVTSRQLQRLLREDIPIRQLILSSYQSKHNETTDDGKFT